MFVVKCIFFFFAGIIGCFFYKVIVTKMLTLYNIQHTEYILNITYFSLSGLLTMDCKSIYLNSFVLIKENGKILYVYILKIND